MFFPYFLFLLSIKVCRAFVNLKDFQNNPLSHRSAVYAPCVEQGNALGGKVTHRYTVKTYACKLYRLEVCELLRWVVKKQVVAHHSVKLRAIDAQFLQLVLHKGYFKSLCFESV